MRRAYLIIILPIVVFSAGHCQNYIFKVMANKGNNQFQLASQSTWQTIKLGSSLNNGDKLLVDQNAYLGLLHASGHTMELSERGTFDIEQLASKVGIRKKGISAKYAEFVLNDLDDKDHGQLRNVIESRGLNAEKIIIFLPFTAKIFNPSMVIHWSKLSGDKIYILSVNNMFGELIKQFETSSNQFQLDLGQDEFVSQKLFIVNVSVKNDNSVISNDIGIEKLFGEKEDLVKREVAQLNDEINSESALGQIVLASYYEHQDLLVDATYHYHEAIKLAPYVPDFETMYHAFLIRNNLHE